ncbi:MAG: DUF438 domain-containing protein [Bacillota bacterium]
MEKVERLTEVLRKLNTPGAPEAVREEARALLRKINPAELSLAEQKLIEDGVDPQQLRHLCAVHLEVLDEQLQDVRGKLTPGHVLDTLYREHDEILHFLDLLDSVNERIQKEKEYDPANPAYEMLRHLGEHLVAAEKHHAREEEVLFPELEKRGITGPPRIMRLEHNNLRPRKHRLLELAETVSGMEFARFREEMAQVTTYVGFHLRDHIYKENTILFPTALEVITDEATWAEMKSRCDAIGYCCFTPTH